MSKIQIISNTLDKITKLGISFIISVCAARFLDKDVFGLFVYITMLISSIITISGSGFDTILTQKISETRRIDKNLILAIFVIRFIIIIILTFFISMFIFFEKTSNVNIIMSFIFVCICSSLLFNEAILVALTLNKQLLYLSIISALIFTILKLYIFIYTNEFYIKYVVDGLEYLFLFFSSIFIVRKFIYGCFDFNILKDNVRNIFKLSFPLWINGIVMVLYSRIDQIYIGKVGTNSDIAYYGIAINLNALSLIIPTAVLTVLFPKLVKLNIDNKIEYEKIIIKLFKLFLLYGLLWVLFCNLFGERIISLIYGNNYIQAAEYLSIISCSIVFTLFGMVAGQWVIISGKYWISFKRSILGILFMIFMYFYFGKSISIQDIASITVINALLVNVILYLVLPDVKEIRKIFYKLVLFK